MAQAIIDSARGLIPMRSPLKSETAKFVVTNGTTVGIGTVVALTSGQLTIPAANADGPVLGVCLEYVVGNGTKTAMVCIDPDMHYRVLGDAAYDAAEVGSYGDLEAVTVSATTGHSTAYMDTSTIAGTVTVKLFLTIMGPYEVVTPETNYWVVVKINNLSLNNSLIAVA